MKFNPVPLSVPLDGVSTRLRAARRRAALSPGLLRALLEGGRAPDAGGHRGYRGAWRGARRAYLAHGGVRDAGRGLRQRFALRRSAGTSRARRFSGSSRTSKDLIAQHGIDQVIIAKPQASAGGDGLDLAHLHPRLGRGEGHAGPRRVPGRGRHQAARAPDRRPPRTRAGGHRPRRPLGLHQRQAGPGDRRRRLHRQGALAPDLTPRPRETGPARPGRERPLLPEHGARGARTSTTRRSSSATSRTPSASASSSRPSGPNSSSTRPPTSTYP